MPDFLSPEWFSSLNTALARVAAPESELCRVVIEFIDAPSSVPHAMTLTISSDACGVAAGDHLAADAMLRLNYADALALAEGRLESGEALREGRVKVRGDVNAIVPLLEWLLSAHRER